MITRITEKAGRSILNLVNGIEGFKIMSVSNGLRGLPARSLLLYGTV